MKDEFGLPAFFESDKIQIAGLIVADYTEAHSHWNSLMSLGTWLSVRSICVDRAPPEPGSHRTTESQRSAG